MPAESCSAPVKLASCYALFAESCSAPVKLASCYALFAESCSAPVCSSAVAQRMGATGRYLQMSRAVRPDMVRHRISLRRGTWSSASLGGAGAGKTRPCEAHAAIE